MATDWARETRRESDQVVILEKSTSLTGGRLSDNLVHQVGSSRKSEVVGTITDNGKPYQEILNDYLDTL
jgi:hypothetical protein